ncbi:glycosyltransferase [Methylobacterium pseudosasicola]|uniref:Glycosyl transferases group 1 n=1 Tax=Methylobacterium pseudosasicola TaxID=582667 RepID=A0A1I4VQ61_9HYPH|nr:glycosyltransferase [Methylobacterium pseudosasicola]SFN03207.1 Glycosyl transferases group 1 [Methylobacterium pseudosasicola]
MLGMLDHQFSRKWLSLITSGLYGRRKKFRDNEKYDVDFSLAMHNRTGKYAIGRDLLESLRHEFNDVIFWIFALQQPPSRLASIFICKLQWVQSQFNARSIKYGFQFAFRSNSPRLHLEPFTVLSSVLRREDAVLIHDIGPITDPELFEVALYKIYIAAFLQIEKVGPHLIFASQASKNEFDRVYLNATPASSRVIYPPINQKNDYLKPSPLSSVNKPFFLTVGSVGIRKNQLRCIKAFAISGLADSDVNYVICGSREPGYEEVADAASNTQGVVLLNYVKESELKWLYENASGFILVSLLEGFGMPLAEAILHNVIPIVTQNSVLEEVSGAGSISVNPLSEEDIASAMIKLYKMSDDERLERSALLKRRTSEFSKAKFVDGWREAIKKMKEINASFLPFDG